MMWLLWMLQEQQWVRIALQSDLPVQQQYGKSDAEEGAATLLGQIDKSTAEPHAYCTCCKGQVRSIHLEQVQEGKSQVWFAEHDSH